MITNQELALVEAALAQAITSEVGLLSEASQYIIGSGGKRVRPRVVLLSYKAVGGQEATQAVPLAAAVELLHTASLIHDDINDHSDVRRGHKTANAQWGNGLALLIGDFVFVKLLGLIADFHPRVIRVLADCCRAIVEGETLQLLYSGDTTLTEDDYLAVVAQKTASLLSACGELGGLLAGASQEQINALKEYGFNMGMAFQIRDDTLDLIGDGDEMGKPVAGDLRQGKVSLAPLFAIKQSEQARAVWASKDATRVVDLLRDTGAIGYAMQRASKYAEKAKTALAPLVESEAQRELRRLADFAIIRNQ